MSDSHTDDVPPPPSAKAQGKRPENRASVSSLSTAAHEQSTPAPPASTANTPKSGMHTRPKRVLPSRSRRGGPGVGSCDVDIMILETRKRRLESEPLIPADTRFLLTTNSALVPSTSDDTPFEIELNSQAYSRYFDLPEVQKAYREQQMIQTPEFSLLPEDAVVGGRFRPRDSHEEVADTSDAAYEKRHRKYETFEKRQRLREKEKLKHEQYKLKERIEQLRAMDTAAFLSLPASSFSEPPGMLHEGGYDEADTGLSDLPGAHVNGAAAYNEAERRRQEMLEVAETLEERYRVLLPPDRKWAEKKEAEKREKAQRESTTLSVEPEAERPFERRARTRTADLPSAETSEEEDELADDKEALAAPPMHVRNHNSDGESEVDFEQRDRERSKGLKIRLRFPPGLIIRKHMNATPVKKKQGKHRGVSESPVLNLTASHGRTGKVRAADGRFMPKHRHRAGTDELSAGSPPAKRYKTSASVSGVKLTVPKAHVPHTAKSECLLLKAAERNAAVPSARKTQRHVHAFGVAVPEEIGQIRDFEIPPWCWPDSTRTDDEDEIDDDGDENAYWNGVNGHGFGSAAPSFEFNEDWAEDYYDTKDEFPEIATLDDD